MTTVALAVNPTSAKGAGRWAGAIALSALRASGLQVTDVTRDSAHETLAAARRAVDGGVDSLVVVGGDGMVHLGANACAGSATRLGIVPAGTGNDVARALGLPRKDPDAAVRVVLAGDVRALDLGRCADSGEWFAGVLGAGFDAVVAERAIRLRHPRGQSRYTVAMLRELPVFRAIPTRVQVDEREWQVEAMLVAVANAPSFGGGMRVAPDARMDDGVFDVVIVHRISTVQFLRVFPAVFRGRHIGHPAVQVLRGRRVRLEAAGITAQADGEAFAPLPLTLECVPAALTVHVPPAVHPPQTCGGSS